MGSGFSHEYHYAHLIISFLEILFKWFKSSCTDKKQKPETKLTVNNVSHTVVAGECMKGKKVTYSNRGKACAMHVAVIPQTFISFICKIHVPYYIRFDRYYLFPDTTFLLVCLKYKMYFGMRPALKTIALVWE